MSSLADWIDKIWGTRGQIQSANQTMPAFSAIESLENYWKSLPEEVKNDPTVKALYQQRKVELEGIHAGIENPLKPVILGMLTDWKEKVAKYDLEDPKDADKKLAGLAADVLGISATVGVVELALGVFPNGQGTVASTKVSDLMGWLGFGAVVTAVAHDPVKVGLLRPYQDSLEAHFRNRRPGDSDLFTAYQQRSLSATKIDDVNAISDTLMTQIESENDAYYDREIAKWGYSEYFSNALKDAATKTLSFGNLMALAKQGRLNRGMAIFSLWGYGLDRRLMKIALDALDQANETANYEGFRAQIEPAFIEGSIDEASLLDYWGKLHIPQDVQGLMIPRFRKKREAYLLKQTTGAPAKERDLTVSQLQQAYQNQLMDRAHAQNAMLTLGYNLEEVKILLDLAEMRRKLPSAQTLKKLPLTDYEKAYKNGLIPQEKVLARMQGEYTPEDIALEKQLLEIGKA
jgi:hypothetical protein